MPFTFRSLSGEDVTDATGKILLKLRPTEEDLQQAAEIVRDNILAKTAEGIDADGAPFAPYSPGYAARKEAAGGGTVVDLYSTNDDGEHMLDSFEFRYGEDADGPWVRLALYGEAAKKARLLLNGYTGGSPPVGKVHLLAVPKKAPARPAKPKTSAFEAEAGFPSTKSSPKGQQPRGNYPARKFLAISAEARTEIKRLIKVRISSRFKDHGGGV